MDLVKLPESITTLFIQQQPVTNNILQATKNSCLSQELRLHLKEKYNWNDTIINDIDWTVLNGVLQKTKQQQQIFNLKFIHHWLPTNCHPSTTNTTRLCPRCQNHQEDQNHWFLCPHDKAVQERLAEIQKLQQHFKNIGLHPTLGHLLIDGTFTNLSPTTLEEKYPTLQTVIKKQTRIGWKQLPRARLSYEWIRLQDFYHPTKNGEQIIILAIVQRISSMNYNMAPPLRQQRQ
jgi:hypothetical protein